MDFKRWTLARVKRNLNIYSLCSVHLFRERNVRTTAFRQYFDRGDLPIARAYQKGAPTHTVLMWRIPPQKLDYAYYLPVVFSGLAECRLPYKQLARAAVNDMLSVKGAGTKILPVVPQLIVPIQQALNTRNPDVIIATLYAIRLLVRSDARVGRALVPYFRQLLPVLNLMRDVNVNIGDQIDFNAVGNVGDHVEQTLQLLERCGGPDAFLNIKYMVPTYESVMMN